MAKLSPAAGLEAAAIVHLHYRGMSAMNDNSFAEQIRKTAEALQDLLRAARDEENRVAEELHKEKAKRKLECSAACQRILLPTMKLFAMGLEAAKVFAPQCWKVDYEPNDDQYCCICWARLPKTDSSAKALGVVIKTTITMIAADQAPPQIQVQVQCHQALPGDWKEIAELPLSEPSEGIPELFVDDLYGLNPTNLDNWHKKRLQDCAKACANWVEQHAGVAVG
jgi:hypothetical protein